MDEVQLGTDAGTQFAFAPSQGPRKTRTCFNHRNGNAMTAVHVGYIGLGAMGGALARRLIGTCRLHVWDLNPQTASRFEAAGAVVAPTAAEVARQCKIVLLCLPRSSDVHHLMFGPEGMAEALAPGSIVIDQTSGVPEETRAIARELALRGVVMLDAPVAGGVAAAEEGRITMMVSGPDSAFQQVAHVLNAISPTVVRCGERLGDGQAIKMLNNAMNAACRLATLEVVAMGRKQGLSLAAMTEAINQSTGRSRISQVALPALLAGKPSSDFALPLMVKDVDQAIHLSMKAGAPIPIAGVARALLQIGVNTVGPKARLEDMIGLIESMAATRLRDDVDQVEVPDTADASAQHPVIGYVGLGAMGGAIARRLLDSSCEVHIHDVRADAVRDLEAAGAVVAPDLPSLARACDVIMICVPTSAVVREVLFGRGGLGEGLSKGKIVVDQTTGDPAATRAMAAELEALGVAMIDAPVSGGPKGAAEGKIVTFCGGQQQAFARVRAILQRTGPTVVYFGPSGSGNVAKLIKNTLGACNRLIAYETVALGVKIGLKLGDMERVINKSSGWTQAFERIMPALASGGQTAQLRLELMVKDLDLACRLGMEAGAPMLIAHTVRSTVEAGANELGGDANLDELSRLYEARAGIRFADAATKN
ncbi:NAD(P)-dependent oxidoreductase [Variovorax sp. LjRoot84]|uniref:NAD(P)-dependent oxidoreductase n=1 Tax=Variovorax sp. LjRoot84 TaxID=3342340 RepID=UPI003ECDF981